MSADEWSAIERRVQALASGIEADPSRLAEVKRHYEALVAAMNNSQVKGEQDALCVFEAVGLLLGQMVANGDHAMRQGTLQYVMARAWLIADEFIAAARAAPHLIVRDAR